jgi:hypothetical protein
MEVYKISLKIELGYSEVIGYDGKDLSMAASLISVASNKLLTKPKKEEE